MKKRINIVIATIIVMTLIFTSKPLLVKAISYSQISEGTQDADYTIEHTGQQAQAGQVLDLSSWKGINKVYGSTRWRTTVFVDGQQVSSSSGSHVDTVSTAQSLWRSGIYDYADMITVNCELEYVVIQEFKDSMRNSNGLMFWDPNGERDTHTAYNSKRAIEIWDNEIPKDRLSSDGATFFSNDTTILTRKEAARNGWVSDATPTPTPTLRPGQTPTAAPRVTPTRTPMPTPTPTPMPPYICYDGNGATTGYTPSNYGNRVTIARNNYSRYGYHFAGYWTANASGGTRYTPGQTISLYNDTTLYAQWVANTCVLTFDYCTGFLGDNVGTFSKGTYGNSLKGGGTARLYNEDDPSGNSYTDITLRADQKTFLSTGTLGELPTPSCEGYRFLGWSILSFDNNGNRYSLVNSSSQMFDFATNYVTLYASWEPLEVNVHFNLNITDKSEINLNAVQDTKAFYLQTYSHIPDISKTGYMPVKWQDEFGNIVANGSKVMVDHDHSLKAIWKPQVYKLSFYTNGGTPVSPIDIYYYDPIHVYDRATYPSLPTPQKEGYVFDGWYLDANCKNRLVTTNTEVAEAKDHTLYAKWKAVSFELTFHYNWTWKKDAVNARINGGMVNISNVTTSTQTVLYNTQYGRLPVPARDGYDFMCWKTANGEIVTTATYHKFLGNLDLYAEWRPKTYLIVLDDNTTTYFTYDDPVYQD